jgi:hypothetical protein
LFDDRAEDAGVSAGVGADFDNDGGTREGVEIGAGAAELDMIGVAEELFAGLVEGNAVAAGFGEFGFRIDLKTMSEGAKAPAADEGPDPLLLLLDEFGEARVHAACRLRGL